ncbi:MAG: hypothetical protein AAF665_08690 [Pseudomonadota bacterium]
MSNDKKSKEQIEKIKRMFRQADKAYGEFSDSSVPPQNAVESDNASDTENVSNAEQGTSESNRLENSLWILSMLENLRTFAAFHQLSEFEACLTDAHREAEKILEKMRGSQS